MIRYRIPVLSLWAWLLALGLLGCTITVQPLPPGATATPLPVPTATTVPTLPTTGPAGQPWWNEAIFYEIFVRSFYDSNGDGRGDLNGITEKLDYLNDGDPNTKSDLGITALWLMPIHPSPSYHGYDVTDYYDIHPQYGTLDDFRRLLIAAHQRGLRVVLDFVANHTSRDHTWFQQARDPQSPYRDWYVWSPTNPGGKGPWGQQIWYHHDSGYYYAVFWDGMPDLNYQNPAVVKEMEQVVKFWVDEIGIDGLRVDGARYLVEDGDTLADSRGNHAWFKHLRQVYKGINPSAMSVGEVWTDNEAVAPYARGDEFDLVFDFDLANALVRSVRDESADAARFALGKSLNLLPTQHTATFLTNHDQNRVMTELRNDVNKAKRAATLLLTLPGTPFLYYGEEIGQVGQKPDEDLRLPLQWSGEANAGFSSNRPWRALAADYPEKNIAVQTDDSNSLLSHYRYLTALRHEHPALRVGAGFAVNSRSHSVLAYLRTSADQAILVVNNLRDQGQDDYGLTLERGSLTPGATYTITPIWGGGGFASLTANAQGGFGLYQPNGGLGPGETLILQLTP
jgi:alpha-amylase